MADDLDLDGLEREALKATQDPVSTAFLTKTNADVDEWMTSVYTAGKDADFRLHCLWAWQEQARRSASTILDLIHRLRAAETAVSQGQADLLAVSAALAEARDNDRAAMGWLVDARAASGDDGKRMLPEFVEYLKELRADAERYQWLINAPATWTPDPVRHWLWSRPCDASRLTITIDDAISEAKKLGGAAPAEISF